MTRSARSFTDLKADRGIAFMLALYVLTHGEPEWIEGYRLTLTQRAAMGARWGDA